MFKHLTFVTLCFAIAACQVEGAPEPPATAEGEAAEAIKVSELVADAEDGKVVLDLRVSSERYWFEHGMDYSAVDVICPSGRSMNMESWMPELEAELGAAISDQEEGFEMYSSLKSGSNHIIPPCFDPCYLHREPDNTWVCFC